MKINKDPYDLNRSLNDTSFKVVIQPRTEQYE
jgi:hypothetical protein